MSSTQNGEDGILEVLRGNLSSRNRYFIEIGAADGIENNTGWLIVVEKYNGLLIEGSSWLAERAKRMVITYSIGAECHHLFVTKESVSEIKAMSLHHDPDILSLDIDGNDYYIAQSIFDSGLRPKIFVVEYNSVYGPDRSVTINYQADFEFTKAHPSHLYYGVSISGWRNFFDRYGYRFISVDRNGVNAFFVDPQFFDESFLNGIKGTAFAENRYQYKKFRRLSEEQFKMIADQKMVLI